MSEVPLPGSIPYKDHIAAIELSELSSSASLLADSTHAVVYLWSMRDSVLTPAARLRSGDRVKLHLFSWDDYSAQYEKFNRSELEDPSLQLQDPTWGNSPSRLSNHLVCALTLAAGEPFALIIERDDSV